MRGRVYLLSLSLLVAAVAALLRAPSALAGAAPAGAVPAVGPSAGRPVVDTRPPGAFSGDGGPSPVVFPAQDLPLRFSHKKHVKELGASCTTCHDRARSSQNSGDSLLPKGTRCDGCHGTNHRASASVTTDEPRPMGQCSFCHVGYDPARPNWAPRVRLPKPNLRFSHQKHVGTAKLPCERCHGRVEELELATRDQLPRMKGCIGCHELGSSSVDGAPAPLGAKGAPASGHRATGTCTTCHLSDSNGVLVTTFPSGKLLPPPWLHDAGHGPDFVERHKTVAGDDSRFCANCHQERFCVNCHDGTVRPRRIHPNDFLSQHAVVARQDNPRCTSCHQLQSFCLTCHQRAGVALSGPVGNFTSRGRFHPPKSVWTDAPRSSQHHAWEAQRNLNACVSCHQERDCALCHATRGVSGRGPDFVDGRGQGVNPHPVGFTGRCREALRQNARPCLVCHSPNDAELLKCR